MNVDEFTFVDSAIGGVNRRNNVVDLADFLSSLNGTPDCYCTFLRFTRDLASYAATNPSPKTGKPPSVHGYKGDALARFVPFDFDSKDDLPLALNDARAFVRRLESAYDVPPKALRIFFSGFKGFSIEAPGTLFGGFAPDAAPRLAARLGHLARRLTDGLSTADSSIYDPVRLWRQPNTRNAKSGLFKVPLDPDELLRLDIEPIRVLARTPRTVELPHEDDFEPRPELVRLWSESETQDTGGDGGRYDHERPERDFPPAKLEPIVAGCAWLRHTRDDAATLAEPEWYAMIGILARAEGGEKLAHVWSRPHPNYTERETAAKIEHSLRDGGPARCERVRSTLSGEPYCSKCPAWGNISSPIVLGATSPIAADDFWAYLPMHQYIYVPTRELWPAPSVNACVKVKDENGQALPANTWLDANRSVEQMTWSPGEQTIIRERLINQGGWFPRAGSKVFNLYRPPIIKRGDPGKAKPWLELLEYLYPDESEHIRKWFAHRVQKPQEKVNHALVLGGQQGIGKDTLLEPLKHAVGPWNFAEVSPVNLLGRFNGFVKSVVLRVSEARDLGDVDRFAFYEHMKVFTAAPPDVLRCDEKNVREYAVFNVCGVVLTTNHKTHGIYLPADDRRHFVAWSERSRHAREADYWPWIYGWYASGGLEHVAAYLATLDLSDFDPKAPPPKTPAFWAIADANLAPEDAEFADALDKLGHPDAVTVADILDKADASFAEWLRDRRNSRQIPHRFEQAGYVAVRSETDKTGGRWRVQSKQVVIYAKATLSLRERIEAAKSLTDAGQRA